MSLFRRAGFWLFVAVLMIVFLVPVLTDSSWSDLGADAVHEYQEAMEAAQGADDNDDDESHGIAEDSAEAMHVRVDDEISDYTGIETIELKSTLYFPEFKAIAEVVVLQPMLALRARHQKALSAVRVAQVSFNSADKELTRLKRLAKGTGSIANKNVSYAQSAFNEKKVVLEGAKLELQSIQDEAVQTWGQTVASWLMDQNAKEWQRLLQHKDSLLLVTLATDNTLASDQTIIRISRDSSRQHARKAYFVSAALSTDLLLQGETYYFKTATGKLRAGMRLDAWVPEGDDPFDAIFIPEHAIVWHEGQPWVYVELEDDHYLRKRVTDRISSVGGYFSSTALQPGEHLVVKGAQMLLSEEFKWQIADEDDD